jgi:hypothetical protein
LFASGRTVIGGGGSGHGRYLMASGGAALLTGKSYAWTTKVVGTGLFTFEMRAP